MKVIYANNSESGKCLAGQLAGLDTPKVLYWGVRPPEGANPDNCLACGPMLDGFQQLQTLAEAGVPVPRYTNDIDEALHWGNDQQLSVWGRQLHHTQGRDIKRFGQKGWHDSAYWVCQIPDNAILSEWRVHSFNGRSIARGKKTQVEILARKLAPVVRSRRNGWRLDHAEEPPKGAKHYAKLATTSSKYLWGAVDMLYVDLAAIPPGIILNADKAQKSLVKSELQPFVVLEVNQRPGMDNSTCLAYAKAIANFVGTPKNA